jgi:hypothetical protein
MLGYFILLSYIGAYIVAINSMLGYFILLSYIGAYIVKSIHQLHAKLFDIQHIALILVLTVCVK